MARKPFVVLDAEILSSSVWAEAAHVKLVWITLLVLCDTEGYVGASLPGIASAAGVTLEQAEEALERFQKPDPYSRTKASEGRRLEPADRGWRVLNFLEHLDRLSDERRKARERVRKHRARKRDMADGNVTVRSGNREQGPEKRDTSSLRSSVDSGGPQSNPFVKGKRVELERELLNLVGLEARATDRDPAEVMAEVTGYKGATRTKTNPASMSDDRLLNSVLDARARWKELEAKRERPRPTVLREPSRGSDGLS